MNYYKIYNSLISKAIARKSTPTKYSERHHIIPKSMGGSDCPLNIVSLTYKEHFTAHHLLWRTFRNKQMAFGFHVMCATGKGREKVKITSRQYETARQAVSFARTGMKFSDESKLKMSLAQSGEKNHNYGKPRSEETKAKISAANKGQVPHSVGKPRSEETKAKISAANKGRKFTKEHKLKLSNAKKGKPGYHLGKPRSEETRLKISQSLKNRNRKND